jgi:Ca2+-binding RTX toxin-like protein
MMSYGKARGARLSRRRSTLALAAVVACTGSFVGVSSAQAAKATWSCGADAVTASVAGMNTINPVTAQRTPCADQTVGLPNVTNAIGLAPTINAKTAYAITSAKPATATPITQSVGAAAGVEGLSIQTGGGTVVIGVGAAQSEADAICKDGKAVLSGTSNVADLTINGQTVSLDGLLSSLTDAISKSPLGGLVSVKLNEQVVDGEKLIQRAAHIKILSAIGANPLVDVVVAQSTVSSSSACDPKADGNGGGTGTGTSGSGTGTSGSGTGTAFTLCPKGATLDTTNGVCIIPASQTGGQGMIVIGRPYTGPAGGTVISLTNARKKYSSPCLSGPGPKFAVVGTNGKDRITGRNDDDRILGLGGVDSIDGGRGNDCLDGGTGGDSLNGGIGNDRAYGMTGNDHLNGGPGTDRLSAGAGNDSINAGFGADQIIGGSGVDFINVATAGPAARVDCGTGKDVVRMNINEKRKTKNCERRYVFNDNHRAS